MIRKIFKDALAQSQSDRRARQYRDLIRREAIIGGQLFGPVPSGGRREFFCLDEHTWVWHEEWLDAQGQRHAVTTRYDLRPHGVFKAQDGQPYRPLTPEEATHLYNAIKLYYKRVKLEVYRISA